MKKLLYIGMSLLVAMPALNAMELSDAFNKPNIEDATLIEQDSNFRPDQNVVSSLEKQDSNNISNLGKQGSKARSHTWGLDALDTKRKLALGAAGATAITLASSSSLRNAIKRWTWDPLCTKWNNIKKNGIAKEIVKPTLATAAAATAGIYAYKWWNNPEEQNKTKAERLNTIWQQHKRKIIGGVGLVVGGALVYKIAKSMRAPKVLVGANKSEVHPELQQWYASLAMTQKDRKQVDAEQILSYPWFMIIDENDLEEVAKLPVLCDFADLNHLLLNDAKFIMSFTNPEQRKSLLDILTKWNQAAFKQVCNDLAKIHYKDKDIGNALLSAQNAKKVFEILESAKAGEARKQILNANGMNDIFISCLEQLSYCDFFESKSSKMLISDEAKKTDLALKESQDLYNMLMLEFDSSLSDGQKAKISELGLLEAYKKAQTDASALEYLAKNNAFAAILSGNQPEGLQALRTFAALILSLQK